MNDEERIAGLTEKYKDCNNRFQSIFNLTSIASKIIDRELTILKVNDALVDLLGYPAEEIEGRKIMDYACKEYVHRWEELQNAMWKEGRPFFKLDACIVKKDQTLAWVHITTIVFKDNLQEFAYTVLDDFSFQKSYEETEKRLNLALQYSKMAVWELDLENGSIFHSRGFNKIFEAEDNQRKWDKEMLLKQFVPEDADKLNLILSNLNQETILDFQGRFKTTDGLIKWVYLQGKTEPDESGRPGKVLGTLYDITKEKLAERHKDDFISIASHELRTPVTALQASLQLMEKLKLPTHEKMYGLVEQANRSMQKISVLIEDLLNASRINEGQLHLKNSVFKIVSVINDCCHHVTISETHNVIIEGDTGAEVYGDSERIQQVMVNFVNNAIKYAPVSKDIHILIEEDENNVKVSVKDSGPGIQKEKIPYLFDRFYRADISGGQYSGLGLGLYISSEIIKKHKGQIGVESEEGKGSTFWFTLPVRK